MNPNQYKLDKVKQIIKERGFSVRKIVYEDDEGNECYLFLMMDEMKVDDFIVAYQSGPINFEDWGTVLFSGYGDKEADFEKMFIDEVFGKLEG